MANGKDTVNDGVTNYNIEDEQKARDAAKLNAQEKQAAVSAASGRADRERKDETEEGGHYIVGGRHVNAYGKPYGTPLPGLETAMDDDNTATNARQG